MACAIWKARKEMNTLGCIFQFNSPNRNTRLCANKRLNQTVPGHPEVAANRLAQVWNTLNLSSTNTLGSVRKIARQWYRQNFQLIP